mgnify:CR=1 FL=1
MIALELIGGIIIIVVGLAIIWGLFDIRDMIANYIYRKLPFIKDKSLRYIVMVIIFMTGYCLLFFGVAMPLFQKL